MLNLLFLGDIVGEPGRDAVVAMLPALREELSVDFVVVNGENAAGGRGITGRIAIDLLRAGAAVITTGDHVWDQKDTTGYIASEPRLLRPINYPHDVPGAGSIVLDTPKGPVGVINVQGQTFMQPPLNNAFRALDAEVERMRKETRVIFVDAHCETTSEKVAIGRFLDGRVSAVVGTHTHVQTADERVFPGGTAFLTDAGMCGPYDSLIGRQIEPVLHRFWTGLPAKFPIARGPVALHGALIAIDETTGRAVSIERLERFAPAFVAA